MKISWFQAACMLAALALGGCSYLNGGNGRVAQNAPPLQTPQNAQNTATSRLQNQPWPSSAAKPLPPVLPRAAVATGKVKVAILLPLSGKNAALGQAMLNAAQMAVFDAAGNNFELQPHDTAGAGGAGEAAGAAMIGGAQLIIGPLFASDVPAVKAVAQGNGLLMLPLSTDTSLAERGVYVMGLAPATQVERVVGYAVAHGAHRFAALVPNNAYGAVVGQAFEEVVERKGGVSVDYEVYTSVAQDGADHIKSLASERDFIDALFLPESGDDLKVIADQLAAAGFDPAHTHILGTGLWDGSGVGRQNRLLSGGWYAAPDPVARRAFVANYTASYGQEPQRLATLAYDATALAAVLAKRGAHYDEAALTNPNGFAGLDGIFRLTASGLVERSLAVSEVTADGARVLDPAPGSFVARGR